MTLRRRDSTQHIATTTESELAPWLPVLTKHTVSLTCLLEWTACILLESQLICVQKPPLLSRRRCPPPPTQTAQWLSRALLSEYCIDLKVTNIAGFHHDPATLWQEKEKEIRFRTSGCDEASCTAVLREHVPLMTWNRRGENLSQTQEKSEDQSRRTDEPRMNGDLPGKAAHMTS